MDTEAYVKSAIRTESRDFESIGKRISEKTNQRLLHAGVGLASEAGELLDALKKHIFYGQELDKVNLAEEVGDIFWHCALIADELDIPFAEMMETNLAKLKLRYGDRFTEDAAKNRDIQAERKVLEESSKEVTSPS